MVVASNDRPEDDRSVDVTAGVVVVVIILKAGENLWVFYLVQTFVILRQQSLLEENGRVLVSVANETLLFLAQFPLG